MTDRTARIITRPDGQFGYEITYTRGPFRSQIEAGMAARDEIVQDALAETEAGERSHDAEPAPVVGDRFEQYADHLEKYVEKIEAMKPAFEAIMARAEALQVVLDDRELAAVLAGLRLLQRNGEDAPPLDLSDPDIETILTDGGQFEPPSSAEIDALCERLNSGGG